MEKALRLRRILGLFEAYPERYEFREMPHGYPDHVVDLGDGKLLMEVHVHRVDDGGLRYRIGGKLMADVVKKEVYKLGKMDKMAIDRIIKAADVKRFKA